MSYDPGTTSQHGPDVGHRICEPTNQPSRKLSLAATARAIAQNPPHRQIAEHAVVNHFFSFLDPSHTHDDDGIRHPNILTGLVLQSRISLTCSSTVPTSWLIGCSTRMNATVFGGVHMHGCVTCYNPLSIFGSLRCCCPFLTSWVRSALCGIRRVKRAQGYTSRRIIVAGLQAPVIILLDWHQPKKMLTSHFALHKDVDIDPFLVSVPPARGRMEKMIFYWSASCRHPSRILPASSHDLGGMCFHIV